MNFLFHYEMVKALARTAGMNEDEAQTTAYASQFADDCAPPVDFFIDDLPQGVGCDDLFDRTRGRFSAVRTAHRGIQYVESLIPAEQRRVWVAFHFVPPADFGKSDETSFVARTDGALAQSLVDRAIDSLSSTHDPGARTGGLIALGLALHSYADTWAHDDFSGIRQRGNKKMYCQVLRNHKWESDVRAGNFGIGHGHSKSPDRNLVWRYRRAKGGPWVEKDNRHRFLGAAEKIYGRLCQVTGKDPDFPSLRDKVVQALEVDSPESVFDGLVFDYNRNAWRKAAMKLDIVKTRSRPSGQREWHYIFQGDNRWFLFQEAAQAQRKFVLSRES